MAVPRRVLHARGVTCGELSSASDAETRERAAILEAIFDHTNLLIAYLDPELRFVRVNRAYAAADQLTPADFVGKGHFELYPSPENERYFREVVRTGRPHFARARPFEYARSPERGLTHWDWSLVPVLEGGRVIGLVLSLLDVSARVRAMQDLHASVSELSIARARLERSLAEKEVLLREVHHRVKNNLQLISSLLYLQRSRIDEPTAVRAFDESRNRILSMAMIHERLYLSGDFAAVDLETHVSGLVRSLGASFSVDQSGIELVADVPALRVPVDIALPCGLVLNELVSNALEHAFVGRSPGRVQVRGGWMGQDSMVLSVEDDGIGLPAPLRANLGLRMVESLATQLGARLEVHGPRGAGTRVRLEVPLDTTTRTARV